ncbi:MAG TPA: peroxidase [Planctomycetes bacterium]|nr:peroxidase [Planctomycetota bacterium]
MEVRDEDLVKAVKDDWRKANLGARDRALCEFAEKLTRTPGRMSEGDLAPLREAGLDDADILDLTQVVGYFNYINRVADALGVPNEPEWEK